MNSFLKMAFALTLFVLSAGCGNTNDHAKPGTALEAYRLIDEQRTDEAIELLEMAIEKEPSNKEYKSVLASAYAHKAGLKIQTLFPIVSKTEKLKKLRDSVAPGNTEVSKVATLLNQFFGVMEVYASLPALTKSKSHFLIHAISILNDMGSSISQEDALYKAILEIVLFKHYLSEEFIGDFIEPQPITGRDCKIDLSALNKPILKMGKLLIDIFNDLTWANPKQSENIKKIAAQTSESISALAIATTTVTELDEAAILFLQTSAIQNGFGKIIKCGGN